MALFWSWYNILILLLACFVCIEQPQRRYRHRFPTNELVQLKVGNRIQIFVARDISVSGIHLAGLAPVPVGGLVMLATGDFTVRACLARVTEDGFALAFEPTIRNRALVIRHIFSKHYSMAERRIRPVKVALAISARLFR
jgi:cellulose synthase (UDP-forming)